MSLFDAIRRFIVGDDKPFFPISKMYEDGRRAVFTPSGRPVDLPNKTVCRFIIERGEQGKLVATTSAIGGNLCILMSQLEAKAVVGGGDPESAQMMVGLHVLLSAKLSTMKAVTRYPYPAAGEVYIHAVTYDSVYQAVATLHDLKTGTHPLSEFYLRVEKLVTESDLFDDSVD